jgi:hypothetical protein
LNGNNLCHGRRKATGFSFGDFRELQQPVVLPTFEPVFLVPGRSQRGEVAELPFQSQGREGVVIRSGPGVSSPWSV